MNPTPDLADLEVGYDIPCVAGHGRGGHPNAVPRPRSRCARGATSRRWASTRVRTACAIAATARCTSPVDVQKLQERLGGAVGVCCQKVSEAGGLCTRWHQGHSRFERSTAPGQDRPARPSAETPPVRGSPSCVDDIANVAELSAAAQKHGTTLDCFVEIDCGARRCGVGTGATATEIAKAIDAASGLKFAGIQAYQGAMQHLENYAGTERREAR